MMVTPYLTVESWTDGSMDFGNLTIRASGGNDVNILSLWDEIKGTAANTTGSVLLYTVDNAGGLTTTNGWTNSENITLTIQATGLVTIRNTSIIFGTTPLGNPPMIENTTMRIPPNN